MGFIIWYGIGLPSAFAARYFLSKGLYDGASLTWGGVIACFFGGLAGPFATLTAIVWLMCCLGDGKIEFLSKPIFKSREDGGK